MLCDELNNYISSAKGLPFFYVVGDEKYNSALSELIHAGLTIVKMSDFCPKDDKFPNVDELIDYFRTSDIDYRDNKFVVVGLGEYLALRGAAIADKELRRLKNTTLGNSRAILLLRGVAAQATRIISDDNKIINQNRAFYSGSLITNASVTNIKISSGLVERKGIKYLLSQFEEGKSSNVITSTELILDNSLFPVTIVSSAYSVIKLAIKDFALDSRVGTDDQWNRLLVDLTKKKKSLAAVFDMYNIDNRVLEDLYYSISGLEYKNWLVFLYLKTHLEEISNRYLAYVISNTNQFDELKKNLLNSIIEFSYKDASFLSMYEERKRLLRDFPEEDIVIFIRANEINPAESIYRLTDNTMLEKKTIVKWISRYGINDAIAYVYPALNAYLKKYIFDCPVLSRELTDYFDAYKKQKISNQISDEFISLVEKHATDITYAQLPTRDNAIKAISNKNAAFLYWMDALGVEYLSYIASLAKRKGLSIHVDIVRSELPTITSINKKFYDEWSGGKKFKEDQLDIIKHKDKGGYFFTNESDPVHIAEELIVIEKAINTAAMELGMHHCKSFVIASDHGASRLAVIKKQEVPYDTDTKGEHSGRCCKVFEGCDLKYVIEENGYLVLSDYGRFRGSRSANVEVHGGASLEEIVVPVITLTLKKQIGVQIYVMNPDNITVDRHEGVILTLFISEVEFENQISIIIDEHSYSGTTEDGLHFVFKLQDIKRAKSKLYSAEVFDASDLIGTVSFKVKGKAATIKDDFDFGDEF